MLNKTIRDWIAANQELLRDFDANQNAEIDFEEQGAIDQTLRQYLFFLTEADRQWYIYRGSEVAGPFASGDTALNEQLDEYCFISEAKTRKWVPAALLLLYLKEGGGRSPHPEILAAIPFLATVIRPTAETPGGSERSRQQHTCVNHPAQAGARRCEMCGNYFCLTCVREQFADGSIICKRCQAEAHRLQPFKQDRKVLPLSQIKVAGLIPITEGRIPAHWILAAILLGALTAPWAMRGHAAQPYSLAIGIIAGVSAFIFGRKISGFMGMIEDTPTAKVKSAAMGRVELKGRAESPFLLTSPYFKQPCIAYHYIKEEYQQRTIQNRYGRASHAGGHWKTVQVRSRSVAFYLQDDTGKALVDPDGAHVDFELARVNTCMNERYTESILPADHELYILGSLRPLDKQSPFADSTVSKEVYTGPTTDKQFFLISSKTEAELLSHLWKLARIGTWGGAAVFLSDLYGIIRMFW